MNDICIVGNGILGLQLAYAVLARDPKCTISIVGPQLRPGCASLAAAAMFNSFCEIDAHTFENEIEKERFCFNKLSNERWPALLPRLAEEAGRSINSGFGTYLINNAVSDELEDENFDAIIAALHEHNEPFDQVSPRDIPFYNPEARCRATRAAYIPREGWVNPIDLLEALEVILRFSNRVEFVDDTVLRLSEDRGRIISVHTAKSGEISAGRFVLCPGAGFSKIVDASNLSANFQRIFYGVGATVLLQTNEASITNCIRTPNRGLACGLYSAPQTTSQTVIGASNFISPEPVYNVRLTSIYTLLKSAMEQLNTEYHRSELVRINIGWRPTSSDTLPLLGPTSVENLFVATGTKRDGLHCSPVIGEYLADLMLTGRSAWDFDLFAPERKPLKYLTREDAIRTLVRHQINAAYQHDFVPAKSRLKEELEAYYHREFTQLHDDVGANDWGIPAELKDMYKYGHIK